MNLDERALLVKLSINKWSAGKTDKEITAEVAENKHAKRSAGRYRKNLISQSALKKINQVVTAARTSHYTLTLPWNDDGSRIITTEGYDHYAKVMRDYRVAMQEAVDEFLEKYKDHVKAAKEELGDMFNKDDYPEPETLRHKFGFDIESNPVPVSRDFRAKVSNAEAKAIVKDIENRTKARLDAAMKDVWERIANVTEKMADKLADYKPRKGLKEAEGIFRDSLVDNVKDLAAVLPSLNINNDPKLTKIHKEIINGLCAFDAEDLREDSKARKQAADAARKIYNKVSQYMA